MRLTHIVVVGLFSVLGIAVSSGGCAEAVAPAASCETVCAEHQDCGGTSCLAMCLQTQSACNVKGQSSSFDDWATNCGPSLKCDGDAFTVSGCPLQEIELISCKITATFTATGSSSSSSSTKGDSGPVIIISPDAGDDDSSSSDDDSSSSDGDDDGSSSSDGDDDGSSSAEPECIAGDTFCSDGCTDTTSDPENCGFCGNVCSGSCTNSSCDTTCESTGCETCIEDETCDEQDSCLDNCGNNCCEE